MLAVREGQFHLYPLPPNEQTGVDNLLFAAFQSRLTLTGTETRALGADVTGLVEADFFGAVNANVSTLRLRHAYVRFDWARSRLLAGQYWSPLFATSAYPQTVSFNTGAPFQPFARFPQIRFSYRLGTVELTGAMSQQRDTYSEMGGAKLQQQAGIPAVHGLAEWKRNKAVLGVGGHAKTLRPQITGDRYTATSVQGYGRLGVGPVTVRGMTTYGSDLVDHLMTGGYVLRETGGIDPLYLTSTWLDAEAGTTFSAGVFGGYLRNLGARRSVTTAETSTRADDMADLWRLAPRVAYNEGKVRLAFELEVTSARYTTEKTARYRPLVSGPTHRATNVRGLAAVYYFF